MIDNKDTSLVARTVTRDEQLLAAGEVETIEFLPPMLVKYFLILDLISLNAAVAIRAVGNPFMVDDDGPRLIDNLGSTLAYLECEISIFAIGRGIAFVEATQLNKEVAANQQRGTRTVIGFPRIIEFRHMGILIAPEIPCRSIAPNDPACFLKAAVGINELRAYQTRSRPCPENIQHGV